MKNKPSIQHNASDPIAYSTVNWDSFNLQMKSTHNWNPNKQRNGKTKHVWPTKYLMLIGNEIKQEISYETAKAMLQSQLPYYDEYYEDEESGMRIEAVEGLELHI